MRFERVLVVGAGQMGSGIAQVMAASGRSVALHDAAPGAVEEAGRHGQEPGEAGREGRFARPRRRATRVAAVDDLVDADLMVEAVVEDEAVKQDIFRRAGAVLGPEAVLASNTSSIPIASLAAVTRRPERVVGMHLQPVVVALIEVVLRARATIRSSAEIVELARELGKTPAEVNDFPGFVSNRILMPFLNEAAHALQDGVAEAEAIGVRSSASTTRWARWPSPT